MEATNEAHIPNQESTLRRPAPNFVYLRAGFEERPLTVLVKRSPTATQRPSAQANRMIGSGMSVQLCSAGIRLTLGSIVR